MTYCTVTLETVGVEAPVELSVTMYCQYRALDCRAVGIAEPVQKITFVVELGVTVHPVVASVKFAHVEDASPAELVATRTETVTPAPVEVASVQLIPPITSVGSPELKGWDVREPDESYPVYVMVTLLSDGVCAEFVVPSVA